MDIIGDGDVPIINRTRNFKDFSKSINYFEVNSKLVPYVDPEDYLRQTAYTVEGTNSLIETDNLEGLNLLENMGQTFYRKLPDTP